MLTRLALGAEIDIASKDEIDGARDDILDVLNKREKPPRPNYFVQSAALPAPGAFSGIVEVGSPVTGRLWNILGYSISGETDAVTSSAGKVALYIGDRPTIGIPTLSQLRVAGLTVPASATFSQKTQWCPSAQSVFFNLSGLTGLIQFVANVFIAEYREDEILDRSGR